MFRLGIFLFFASAFNFCFAQTIQQPRYAYATIHYEGTTRDAEYLLGIRVLIDSIKRTQTPHDILVLASDTVSEKSKTILQQEGAKIVEVSDLQNPFEANVERRKYYNSRFGGAMNKLHIWNLTNYERVIYFDADNLLLHNMDELFQCGHLCVVYMSVASFHTGLLVVKPNRTLFENMLNTLYYGDIESYDGADQGFLVSYFTEMQSSPMFDPSGNFSHYSTVRLPIGYNINHFYYYEKGNWDNGWRQGQFKHLRIPAYSLAFPSPADMKPWYWWPHLWFQLHWIWGAARQRLNEDWSSTFYLRLVLLGVIVAVPELVSLKVQLCKAVQLRAQRFRYFFTLFTLLMSGLSAFCAYLFVPHLMPSRFAIPLFILYQNFFFFFTFGKIFQLHSGTVSNRAQMLLFSILFQILTYFSISFNYHNAILKIWSALISIILYLLIPPIILNYTRLQLDMSLPPSKKHSPKLTATNI